MFVDSLVVFVIFAERILILISLSESLDTRPAQLEDKGQELRQWPAVGPPHPAWARRGQGSASAPQGGVGGSKKIAWPLHQHFLCPLPAGSVALGG